MEIETLVKIVKCLDSNKTAEPPLKVGEKYFIRSVTHYYTGRLKAVCGQFLILEDAAWIADTGRLHDFLKDGKCNEYEGFVTDVTIPLGGVVDISVWKHELFRGQK